MNELKRLFSYQLSAYPNFDFVVYTIKADRENKLVRLYADGKPSGDIRVSSKLDKWPSLQFDAADALIKKYKGVS